MRSTIILSFAVLILFFNSCATIISGTSQKVKVTTNVPANILVDGLETHVDEQNRIKLARRKAHVITVQKEGYKAIDYTHRRKVNKLLFLNFITPVGILLTKAPKEIKEVVLLTIPVSFLPLAAGDIALSGGYKFDKQLNFDLIKLPTKVEGGNIASIYCNGVNLKILPGSKIGSYKNAKGEVVSSIFWQSTVNVGVDDMTVLVNNQLSDFGYSVPGLSNNGTSNAKYILNSEVLSIDYTIINGSWITTCDLNVKWELLNKNTKKPVYSFETQGKALKQESGGTAVILEAFTYSLYSLLNKEEFNTILKTEQKPALSADNTLAAISIISNAVPEKNISKMTQSVVTIETDNGHGSGVIISKDGYIVTNHHVIDGYKEVNVLFSNGFSFIGEVVRFDADNDLALIKVKGSGFTPLKLNKDGSANLGDDVIAIGTPADKSLGQTVTKGIISGNRLQDGKKYIQTDVSINPGNSGGPLMNKDGEIIGIVTSKIVGKGIEGIGFAIPSSTVLEALKLNYE